MKDNYSNQNLYFNVDVFSSAKNKTIAKAGSVHYCEKFEFESYYSERHERKVFYANFYLADGNEISLSCYESAEELQDDIHRMAVPVEKMKEAFDYYGRHQRSLAVDPIAPFK